MEMVNFSLAFSGIISSTVPTKSLKGLLIFTGRGVKREYKQRQGLQGEFYV